MNSTLLLVVVVATALAFDFTNGFHDTANVVATSISTRAMAPRVAVGYAAAVITPIWRSEAATILLAGLLLAVCAREFVRSVGGARRARLVALQAAAGLSLVLAGTAAARLLLPPGEVSGPSLLVYEAASRYDADPSAPGVGAAAAMAKLYATETAQAVVDAAVQVLGARALERGHLLEHLYREVRAPRIYEGTSEIQRSVIARELFRGREGPDALP